MTCVNFRELSSGSVGGRDDRNGMLYRGEGGKGSEGCRNDYTPASGTSTSKCPENCNERSEALIIKQVFTTLTIWVLDFVCLHEGSIGKNYFEF